ncbi:MAG: rhomboid-like protein [Jatrophihabitans sp.]
MPQAASNPQRVAGLLPRLPFTISFLIVLALVNVLFAPRAVDGRHRMMLAASTNLAHLRHGRLDTLVSSAFVLDEVHLWVWWVGTAAVLAGAEIFWRWRAAAIFAAAHVGATAAVAAGLAISIGADRSTAASEHAVDVGISYGAVALATSMTIAWPGVLRWLWAAGWLAGTVDDVVADRTFADVGHLLAALIGLGVAVAVARTGRAPPRALTAAGAASALSAGFAVTELDAPAFAVPLVVMAIVAGLLVRREMTDSDGG